LSSIIRRSGLSSISYSRIMFSDFVLFLLLFLATSLVVAGSRELLNGNEFPTPNEEDRGFDIEEEAAAEEEEGGGGGEFMLEED